MNKKLGITVTMMVVTVAVLIILTGTITFSMQSTINYSTLSTWANEITYIQDVVEEQMTTSSAADFTLGEVIIDVSRLTEEEKAEQFAGETISDNSVTLMALDLNKLKITNTSYGNLEESLDVYAISNTTGRVYYVQGIEVEQKIYHSLTEELRNRFNITTSVNNLTTVVFVPSATGYTKEPITVTVKIPNTYTDIGITTSNSNITIGSQEVKEKTYEYVVNSNLVADNYTISVTYNNGVNTLTSTYKVNGYDVTPPVINELADENFVYKQTENTSLYYAINVNATDESGIKLMKYTFGEISEADAWSYFRQNGNIIVNRKINLDRNITNYTIYAEDNAGNFSVYTFEATKIIPIEWRTNVISIVDGVPIPKGFVASPYDGEKNKEGGLVIYELANTETAIPSTETHQTSLTTRNQYVWVPVENFSDFVRGNYNNTKYSNVLGTNYWEVVINTTTNMPELSQDSNYITNTTPEGGITNTLAEVQAMYESVREYKGFYIARYEAGIETQRTEKGTASNLPRGANVYSRMNKIPYTYIPWMWNNAMNEDTNGAVEVARSMYPVTNTNYGVVSTLTYGVQWDAVLKWWLDVDAKDINGNKIDVEDSTDYGNYTDHTIAAGDLNEGTKYAIFDKEEWILGSYQAATSISTKAQYTSWALSTGALKAAKVNNVYDMAGNVQEWTMEGYSTISRVSRGGGFASNGGAYLNPVDFRVCGNPVDVGQGVGFRSALYIKI